LASDTPFLSNQSSQDTLPSCEVICKLSNTLCKFGTWLFEFPSEPKERTLRVWEALLNASMVL